MGEAECAIAGGVESMTRAPFTMPKTDEAFDRAPPPVYDTTLGWRYPNPRMAARFELQSMGETAENVAAKWGVARADQDAFALESHRRRGGRVGGGRRSRREVVPVPVPQKKGESGALRARRVAARATSSLEALAQAQAGVPRRAGA